MLSEKGWWREKCLPLLWNVLCYACPRIRKWSCWLKFVDKYRRYRNGCEQDVHTCKKLSIIFVAIVLSSDWFHRLIICRIMRLQNQLQRNISFDLNYDAGSWDNYIVLCEQLRLVSNTAITVVQLLFNKTDCNGAPYACTVTVKATFSELRVSRCLVILRTCTCRGRFQYKVRVKSRTLFSFVNLLLIILFSHF